MLSLNLLLWLYFTSSATIFTVGKYADHTQSTYAKNLNENRELTIPGVEALEVRIEGMTEQGYDFLSIYDAQKILIHKLSGPINTAFTIKGTKIYLHFYSDNRSEETGVKVEVRPASLFGEFKSRLLRIADKILKQGTAQIHQKVTAHLTEFKNISKNIPAQEQPLREMVIAQLSMLTKIYQDTANLRSKIMDLHQTQFALITSLKDETVGYQQELQKNLLSYQNALHEAQAAEQDSTLSPFEQNRLTVSIQAYQRIIEQITQQQLDWQQFTEKQELLEHSLKGYSKKVELLFHFLAVNATVYEQATRLALMHTLTSSDLHNLIELNELEKMVNALAQDEQAIHNLLKTIHPDYTK